MLLIQITLSFALTCSNIHSQNASRRDKSAGNNRWVVCLLNGCHPRLFFMMRCTFVGSIFNSRPIARVLVCGLLISAPLTTSISRFARRRTWSGRVDAPKPYLLYHISYEKSRVSDAAYVENAVRIKPRLLFDFYGIRHILVTYLRALCFQTAHAPS